MHPACNAVGFMLLEWRDFRAFRAGSLLTDIGERYMAGRHYTAALAAAFASARMAAARAVLLGAAARRCAADDVNNGAHRRTA